MTTPNIRAEAADEHAQPQPPQAPGQNNGQTVDNNIADPTERDVRKRAKKGQANPDLWHKNKNKILRSQGKMYEGVRKDPVSKKNDYHNAREPRVMGPGCSSRGCEKSSLRHCSEFTPTARQEIFDYFWKMDWDQRKVYVTSIVDVIGKGSGSETRRAHTINWHLKHEEKRLQVCKNMFLSTLGIGEWMARNWVLAGKHGMCETSRHKKTPSKSHADIGGRTVVRNFLESLPKLPSHYCRASSEKQYLEPLITSKSQLHRLYEDHCTETSQTPVSRQVFVQEFEKMNLGLFQPKKDQCDKCCGFSTGNISEAEHTEHLRRKEEARTEKASDKKAAEEDNRLLITMDLQAVLLSPCLYASAVYYKTKLACHNFTIYRLSDHHVVNYFWHEAEGGLSANAFASCLENYLESNMGDHKEVTIYSDGCTYQNRNALLSNMLLNVAVTKDITITHKYLEPGHTQMECDSVHSTIEQKLRKKSMYCPANYVQAIKEARRNMPYEVKYLTHDFFTDYSTVQYYSSIRPGIKKGDPVVTDVRQFQYSPDGTIHYKLRHTEEWSLLPRTSTAAKPAAVKTPLYQEAPKIKQTKYKHLQELKAVIPRDYHAFYDNLPYM